MTNSKIGEIAVLVAALILMGVGLYFNFTSESEQFRNIASELFGAGAAASLTAIIILIVRLFKN